MDFRFCVDSGIAAAADRHFRLPFANHDPEDDALLVRLQNVLRGAAVLAVRVHQVRQAEQPVRGELTIACRRFAKSPFHFPISLFLQRKLTEEQPKPHKSAVAEVQPKAVVPEAVSETETGTKSRTLQFIPEVDATAHPRLLRVTSNSNIPVRQNFGLVVIVYASASLVYIQFMLLAVFLQSTTTPPGLVFLVSSLGYIGFIVFQVSQFLYFSFVSHYFPLRQRAIGRLIDVTNSFCMSRLQICFVKAKTKEDGSVTAKKAAKPKSIPAHSRLIRSTTRRFLYFHNKTLSKIKLL